MFGINDANSKFPCPWCKWDSKKELHVQDIDNNWTISDRSHKEALECLNKKDSKGYVNEGLFPFIEFDRSVVDVLHLTLRITDKLFAALLLRLEELEENNSSDLSKRPLTKIFWDFVEIECNVTHPFYKKEKNNIESNIKLRKLNQNERN